jgi:hypothetical protein
MKIAYCLRGIHYIDSDHYRTDFTYSIDNNNKYIIDEFKKHIFDIDYFISTYDSEKLNSLIDYYKPVEVRTRKYSQTDERFHQQCLHHLNLIEMILNYETTHNIKYDLIVNTRFDLIFFRKLSQMNIDITKINSVFKHTSGSCDDNFILIPRNYLMEFYIAIKHIISNSNSYTHTFAKYLPDDIVHYMYEMKDIDEVNKTEYQYFGFNRIPKSGHPSYSGKNNLIQIINNLNIHYGFNINQTDLLIKYGLHE